MEYGINVRFFGRDIGLEKAAELIAQAGFTQLDYVPYLLDEAWETSMKEAKAIFDAYGLTVHQTHAPFNRYGTYGDLHKTCMARCAEATEFLGAKFMVAHGDEFDFDRWEFTPERALEYNHALYLPYVENNGGYKVAFETVFEDMKTKRRYTSNAEELLSLIRSFNSPHAVCCWDSGHSHVAFKKEAPDIIQKFGKLIQCTHIHDNAGNDSHQMPLTGDINWNATADAFRQIGYHGIISLEYAHGCIPEHLAKTFINLSYGAVSHIWSAF